MHNYSKKTIEQLKRLNEYSSFKTLISEIRSKIGIPETGFTKELTYGDIINNDTKFCKALRVAANKIITKYDLSKSMQAVVEDYIMDGASIFEEGQNATVYSGHCVDTDYTGDEEKYLRTGKPKDYVSIQIYPGAEKSDVKELIDKEWSKIKKFLEKKDADKYKKRLKVKPKRNRDKQLLELNKKGVLTNLGAINIEKAKKFFDEQGIKHDKNLLEVLKNLIKDFPNSQEARKKAIEKLKYKEKN